MDFFENEFFKDGFLYKDYNIATMLSVDEVNPTLDEINTFSLSSINSDTPMHGRSKNDINHSHDPASSKFMDLGDVDAWKNKVDLAKGDTVRVIDGDLKNLVGVVVATHPSNDTVRVIPLEDEIKDTILDFPLKQLVKIVKVRTL
jgi:transcription elongation factor SPT5